MLDHLDVPNNFIRVKKHVKTYDRKSLNYTRNPLKIC